MNKNHNTLKIKANDKKILESYRDYAKGIISIKELSEIMKEKGYSFDELDNELERKLEQEYKSFINSLIKNNTKEEILNKAYEITTKSELKSVLMSMDLYPKEKAILLDTEDILDEFYKDWLDEDTQLGESLYYSIENSIAGATKYYNKQGKFKPSRYSETENLER